MPRRRHFLAALGATLAALITPHIQPLPIPWAPGALAAAAPNDTPTQLVVTNPGSGQYAGATTTAYAVTQGPPPAQTIALVAQVVESAPHAAGQAPAQIGAWIGSYLKTDRTHIPNDDSSALMVAFLGPGMGTDTIYIAPNSDRPNQPAAVASITMDQHAVYGLNCGGPFDGGLLLVRPGKQLAVRLADGTEFVTIAVDEAGNLHLGPKQQLVLAMDGNAYLNGRQL